MSARSPWRSATGYRVRPATRWLIKSVRIPLPLAEISAFHKIAKRRFDDISSVAVGFAIEVVDGEVVTAADRPRRRRRHPDPGPRHRGGAGGWPWSRETVRVAAGVLRQEGTPIDDQRATADYRPPCSAPRSLRLAQQSRAERSHRGSAPGEQGKEGSQ